MPSPSIAQETALLDELTAVAIPGGRINLASAWQLLRHGASVTARDRDGRTVLHQAMITTGVTAPFVRALIQAGADVNAARNDHLRPLHHAAARGDLRNIRLLVAAGAHLNVNSPDMLVTGMAPLHMAIQNRHADAVDLLIDLGADVNHPGWNHRMSFCQTLTALHLAVQTDQVTVMERLIAAGADPSIDALLTDTQGPLPVSSRTRLLDMAQEHAAWQSLAWLERQELLDDASLSPTRAPARAPRRL